MNNCSCIWINLDGEGPELFTSKDTIARKEHKCNECKRIIKKGEEYKNERGKWVGNFEVWKTCIDCLSIRDSFFCDGMIYGEILSDLKYHIHDHSGIISENCMIELTSQARGVVCEMIEDYWEVRYRGENE